MAIKILVVGPAWVGDMIMAQSLFKLLHEVHPNLTLDVLAPEWTFALLARMKEVNLAIPMPIGHGKLQLKERYRLGKALREQQYDQAIVLPNSFKSALIPWFARIKKRTGYIGEYRYGLLNDARKLDKKRGPLMIEQFMALGLPANQTLPNISAFYPSFVIDTSTRETTRLKHQPISRGKPILALCAGAEFGPAKRWPAAYYAYVAEQKMVEGWDVWLFGSPKDRAITDEIMKLTNQQCENLAGRLQLNETIDLLSFAHGVITNDSGLMHAAAALNKPLIAIYGSTSPAFTPPLGKKATILQLKLSCQPCFKRECPLKHLRCLNDISPKEVLQAMLMWEQT